MEPEAASLIVELCRGEPFLFQLAGEHAWYAGEGDTITAEEVRRGWRGAQREATAHVERILERLPSRERQFLQAMAELPPADRTLTLVSQRVGLARATDAGPTPQPGLFSESPGKSSKMRTDCLYCPHHGDE